MGKIPKMKTLLGYLMINQINKSKLFKGRNSTISDVQIFALRNFMEYSIDIMNVKQKYFICKVYTINGTHIDNSLILSSNRKPLQVLNCYQTYISKPYYVGNLGIWKDMYNHGVKIDPSNMALRNWILDNVVNKLSIEPRFKYNPVLEMLCKLEKTESISSSGTVVSDVFDEGIHVQEFSHKYVEMTA